MRRGSSPLVALALAACSSNGHPAGDARVDVPDGADASDDADALPACPTTLLDGRQPIDAQGWSVTMQSPATVSYGADYVELTTTTASNETTGGQLLLYRPGALEPGMPFELEVVMLVATVSPHNPLDSAAAIMGSYTPPFGSNAERAQMLALDADAIGFADTAVFDVPVQTSAYHSYVLSVDAGGAVRVSVDGADTGLTRMSYTSNGTIAIGDQTNELNIDSTLRIRSVIRRCVEP